MRDLKPASVELTLKHVGRPRLHLSVTERVAAYRTSHNLQRVTLDVPREFTKNLRNYARLLRQHARELENGGIRTNHSERLPNEDFADQFMSTLVWRNYDPYMNLDRSSERFDAINLEILTGVKSRVRALIGSAHGFWRWKVQSDVSNNADLYYYHTISSGITRNLAVGKKLAESVMRMWIAEGPSS